jgi:hypothetical protein
VLARYLLLYNNNNKIGFKMKKLFQKVMKIFKDMLTEFNKDTREKQFSQGRVYLLWSVIAYYITLGILLVAGLHKAKDGANDIDVDKFNTIIEALKYAMVLFGGYVFGGKFLDVVKVVGGGSKTEKKSDTEVQ